MILGRQENSFLKKLQWNKVPGSRAKSMNAIGGVQKTRFKKFYSKGIGYEKVSRKLVLKKIETKRGTIKQSKAKG